MRFFCILLKSDKSRVKNVLSNIKIPELEIFPAIEGNTNQLEFCLEGREIKEDFLKICKRGELACLLSHVNLWKKMIRENIEEVVILEDDCSIEDNFINNFNEIHSQMPKSYEFLYLYVHPGYIKHSKVGNLFVKGYKTCGTVGYLIKRSLAIKLVDFFKYIHREVDISISWYFENNNIEYYCATRNIVNTLGNLYSSRKENAKLGSIIGTSDKYINNTGLPKFYIDESEYLCYPCCDTLSNEYNDSQHSLLKSKDKYLYDNKIVGFNSNGDIKTSLENWVIDPDKSLYIKAKNHRKKAILLTGGAGYIGSHCLLELILIRYEDIVIIDNFSNSTRENVNKIKSLGNVFVYDMDILDDEIEEIFEYHNIDSVIHFAAYKSVGESVKNPSIYYENNIGGLLNLLYYMNVYSVKKIIFSSSATVYGQPENVPIKEDAKINLLNPYGKTKYFCEEILKDYSNAYDIKVINLRYFNPVGTSSYHILKENIDGANLFPKILKSLVDENEKLVVYGNDYSTKDGTCVRDYIHVEDLAKGHVVSLDYFEKMETNFEIFNLGTERGYSVLEILKAFSEKLNMEIVYKIEERRGGDAEEIYADCSKANELLNWKAEKDIKEMVLDGLYSINF